MLRKLPAAKAKDLAAIRKAIDAVPETRTSNVRGEPRSYVSFYRQSSSLFLHLGGAKINDSGLMAIVVDAVNKAMAK